MLPPGRVQSRVPRAAPGAGAAAAAGAETDSYDEPGEEDAHAYRAAVREDAGDGDAGSA